jgi:hypothetical protein
MFWMLAILGVIFLCFIAYMVIRGETKSWFAPRENPPPATGYKPSIRPATPNKVTADLLLTFKGDSAQRTERFFLDCAIYRIAYQFPPDKKVKLELVSADGDNRKLLANKAGFDSSTFNVGVAKYYYLDIAPAEPETPWAVIIKPF